MIENVMQIISEYRAWVMSIVLLLGIGALYYVIMDIFRDAVSDLKEL